MEENGMQEQDRIREEIRCNLPKIRLKMDSRIGPVLVFESNKRKIGLAFCHRRKDRSLRISGYTFPLCARCTGLWLGFAMGLLVRFAGLHMPLIFAFVLMLPLTVDGLTQLAGYRESNNRLRLLSGILFGIAANMLFFGMRL
jgi:uncharacterized membrane protein